jgi:hypothetical protein
LDASAYKNLVSNKIKSTEGKEAKKVTLISQIQPASVTFTTEEVKEIESILFRIVWKFHQHNPLKRKKVLGILGPYCDKDSSHEVSFGNSMNEFRRDIPKFVEFMRLIDEDNTRNDGLRLKEVLQINYKLVGHQIIFDTLEIDDKNADVNDVKEKRIDEEINSGLNSDDINEFTSIDELLDENIIKGFFNTDVFAFSNESEETSEHIYTTSIAMENYNTKFCGAALQNDCNQDDNIANAPDSCIIQIEGNNHINIDSCVKRYNLIFSDRDDPTSNGTIEIDEEFFEFVDQQEFPGLASVPDEPNNK